MATYAFDTNEDADTRRRRRRQNIAELLAEQADTKPIQSPWQGAAKMANAGISGLILGMEERRDRETNEARNTYGSALGAELDRFGGGGSPVTAALAGKPIGGPIKLGGFEPSVGRVLEFEGGLNPRDTNGTPSNMGINQAANPDVDVTKLTPQGATEIYRKRYWDAIGADKMDPRLAHVAFDTAVIAGPGKANELLKASGGDPEKFLALREEFQNKLLAANPEKFGPYAKAWGNRVATLRSDVGVGGGGAPGGMMAFGSQPGPGGPIQVAQANTGGGTMNDANRLMQIATDSNAPPQIRERAKLMLSQIPKPRDPLEDEAKRLTIEEKRRNLSKPLIDPTTTEREYERAKKEGFKGDLFDFKRELAKAGASNVTVPINTAEPGDKEFFKKLDEGAAKRWETYKTRGDQAQAMVGDLTQLREISKVVGQQGAGVNVKAALGPYAEALGIDIKNLSDIQTFESIVQRLAPQLREPGSGSTSDIEFKGFLKSIGPLSNNPQARERIIDTFEAFARHDMARADIATRLSNREISRTEAEKEIRALPDPLSSFRQFKKESEAAAKAAPAPGAPGQKVRRYNPQTGRFEEVTQ